MSRVIQDANEAVASVAYRLNEVLAIYPITPASPMGEWADEWATRGQPNLWGAVPTIAEMQSEAGAAGAVHGALQAGALTTTFTASQGLLLMIPNLYKIAGELTPFVLHVAARSVATHALSIFCDHSDVMACRQTGFAMLCAESVEQARDFAAIAQVASLSSRVPFMHFFDGFRTSHELVEVEPLGDGVLRELFDPKQLEAYRHRALTPDRPTTRGTAQNPDVFFQAREAVNLYYDQCPEHVAAAMQRFAALTGRQYAPFSYAGHPQAERVIVAMGSGAVCARETAKFLADQGERVGAVSVHLYRPFAVDDFIASLPSSVSSIAVLDRTKEPGGVGEPLYLDVVSALSERWSGQPPRVIGGRYGLSSKEFTPGMVRDVFAALQRDDAPRHFSVGIVDDVTGRSLPQGEPLGILGEGVYQAMFFGLGSDGTVGANKNSIKIAHELTGRHAQGYFVYDSKKAGAITVSHLRFSESPIAAPYLIDGADFIGCHQFDFVQKLDLLDKAKPGATLLINSPYAAGEVWEHLPVELQQQIIDKQIVAYVVDAYRVAGDAGLGRRINTVMQTCFFTLSSVAEKEAALREIKLAIERSYAKKGRELVRRNHAAVDQALNHLERVMVPKSAGGVPRPPPVSARAPEFVKRVTAVMLAGKGDGLPVSAFPVDGTWPTATAQWEKRNIASEIPVWDPKICIQCNKCTLMCPHAAIRAKVYDPKHLSDAPKGFLSSTWKAADLRGQAYTIQIAPEDCTGCHLCVEVCPARDKANPRHKALHMEPQRSLRDLERERYAHFLDIPEAERSRVHLDIKGSQLLLPLFEYSGACPGCGETPYIKLLTQLFGDRTLITNATGCSSIYGGNLPTTPYTVNAAGRGPAWSNSLFEDNAEFGYGFRLAVDAHQAHARQLVERLSARIGEQLTTSLLNANQDSETSIDEQRVRVRALQEALLRDPSSEARQLRELADYLVKKSVWIVGGDGWAYDIGYGGLDHVLASHRDVNILVLDTEVYSNTGGQQSKATPLGAAAKFAAAGKEVPKKDLGLLAMTYGHVYVARVASGAKDAQTLRAFLEAEAHPGPSLIIAYSHCIAHGYDLMHGAQQQKLAVESGVWPLFRFDPARVERGEPPLVLDSGKPKRKPREYMQNETRFRMVEKLDPKRFQRLVEAAERDAARRAEIYEQLARLMVMPDHEASVPVPRNG